MIWLLIIGISLLLLGLWGGPRSARNRRSDVEAHTEKPTEDAWEIITRPVEQPEIQYPQHRPWYLPRGERRFQQGLMVGLGGGLLVGALALWVNPGLTIQPSPPPGPAALTPPAGGPAAVPGVDARAPGAVPLPTTPGPTAPRPANLTLTVDPGEYPTDVAARLRSAGVIPDEQTFLQRLVDRGLDTRLKSGTFVIPTGVSVDEVIDALTA